MAEGRRLAVQGHQGPLHLGSDAADRRSQPDQERVHRADRHRGRDRDRPARAGSRQGHPGRPGPARHLRPLLSRPVLDGDLRAGHRRSRPVLQGQARSRDAGLRLGRLLAATGQGPRGLRRQVGRHSLRHPDLHHHVPQGHSRKARHQAADQLRRIHRRGEADHRSREGQWHLRHRPPGEVGPLLARMRLDRGGLGPWRRHLRRRQEVHGQ